LERGAVPEKSSRRLYAAALGFLEGVYLGRALRGDR
jgi:hypothetical protein